VRKAIDDLQKKLSGELYLLANEDNWNQKKFDILLNKYINQVSGNFKVHIKLETHNFGILDIISQKYRTFPKAELKKFLLKKQNFIEKIKVEFNEE